MLKIVAIWIWEFGVLLDWTACPELPKQTYEVYRLDKTCVQSQFKQFTLMGETTGTLFLDDNNVKQRYCFLVRSKDGKYSGQVEVFADDIIPRNDPTNLTVKEK